MDVVLCAGAVPAPVAARLSAFGQVVTVDSVSAADLAGAVGDAVAIVARANAPLTAAVLDAAPRLRVIGRSGTGTDNVDLARATARGIPVVVTPDAGTEAVAEGALAMLLALGRRLPSLHQLTVTGRWAERDSVQAVDVADAVVGIVGFGRIGRHLGGLLSRLGARIKVFDPYLDPSTSVPGLDQARTPEELFASCDFLSLHLPLTDQSRHLIDADLLAVCQPGTVLVNASRGGLIRSLDDLADALDRGQLGGVGLDVYEPEPPDPSHRLFRDPRVIATPHMLALSRAGRRRIYEEMCDGVEAVLRGGRAPHIANPDAYHSGTA